MNNQQDIIELIHLKLQGRISPQEERKLNKWINKKTTNEEAYERYKEFYKQTREVDVYVKIDPRIAWYKITAKIKKKAVEGSEWFGYIAVAVLTLMIATSITVWFITEPIKVEVGKIAPPEQVVIQTEQQVIRVDNVDEDDLISLKGAQVSKVNNQLVYTGKKKNRESEKNTLIVPRGSEYTLILSDGTSLMANADSKVIFPTVFWGEERRITLESGEVFLDVARNPDLPFVVSTRGIDVKVLGTSFNLNAYADNPNVSVSLVEGKVRVVSSNDQLQFNASDLAPGQQFQINLDSRETSLNHVDVQAETAWTRGEYYFENVPLEEIMLILSRWYNCEVIFKKEAHKKIIYSGRVKKYEHILNFLKAIERIEGIKFQIYKNKVILK